MKLRILDVEGNPEELATFYKGLGGSALGASGGYLSPSEPSSISEAANNSGVVPESSPEAAKASGPVSLHFARRVLSRRVLSPQMKLILKQVHDAHPTLVPSADLQTLTSYTGSQLAGLFGAFGRRVANTDGHVPGLSFWKYEFDQASNAWCYGLVDEAREAIHLEGIA